MTSAGLDVLLIEDSPSDAGLIEELLVQGLANGVRTTWVDRMSTALECLAARYFDVVLLDLGLPDSDGLQTLDTLQSQFPVVPKVVLTGIDDDSRAAEALRRGAQDYLVKGQFENNALARAVRYAIERQRRVSAEDTIERVGSELAAARRVQQLLFPQAPPQIPGLDVAGRCVPAESVGGDCYDYFRLPSGRWGFLVADVSSHGLGPALIMAGARQLLRTMAQIRDDPVSIISLANRALYEDIDRGQFMTLFYAAIEPKTRQISYSNGGHVGYLFDNAGKVRTLSSLGFPLGLVQDAEYCYGDPLVLFPGYTLLLMTDGVQEAQDHNGSLLGRETALEIVRENLHRPAEEILDVLFAAVSDFCHPSTPKDDVTALIIKGLA